MMSHARWRSWVVPAAGALLLASSFAPWWVLKLADGGRLAQDGTHLAAVSAWQASGWWALAVAIALAVAVVWTGWRLMIGGVPGWLCGLLILVSVAPIMLAVHQWRSITPPPELPPGPPAELSVSAYLRSGDDFTHPGIDPHRLYLVDGSSLSWEGPGWGLYAGVTCLVLVTVALLVSTEADHRPSDRAR